MHVQSCCFANHANLLPNGLYGEALLERGTLLKDSGFHLLKNMKRGGKPVILLGKMAQKG